MGLSVVPPQAVTCWNGSPVTRRSGGQARLGTLIQIPVFTTLAGDYGQLLPGLTDFFTTRTQAFLHHLSSTICYLSPLRLSALVPFSHWLSHWTRESVVLWGVDDLSSTDQSHRPGISNTRPAHCSTCENEPATRAIPGTFRQSSIAFGCVHVASLVVDVVVCLFQSQRPCFQIV